MVLSYCSLLMVIAIQSFKMKLISGGDPFMCVPIESVLAKVDRLALSYRALRTKQQHSFDSELSSADCNRKFHLVVDFCCGHKDTLMRLFRCLVLK